MLHKNICNQSTVTGGYKTWWFTPQVVQLKDMWVTIDANGDKLSCWKIMKNIQRNISHFNLGDKTITISIAIDTWSISIENMFDRIFDHFTEPRQKQVICKRRNTVRGPVAGREVYARNCVYFRSKQNLISDTDCRASVSLCISAMAPLR